MGESGLDKEDHPDGRTGTTKAGKGERPLGGDCFLGEWFEREEDGSKANSGAHRESSHEGENVFKRGLDRPTAEE